MQATNLAQSYIEEEISAYSDAARALPRMARRRFPIQKQRIWHRRIRDLAAWLDTQGAAVPPGLVAPYGISVPQRVRTGIPLKYQYRALNTLRELARAHVLFPHFLGDSTGRGVLDLSAGGCGIAEVFGHFGHHVTVCDYYQADQYNDTGHSYSEIHREIGVECDLFDGRHLPYGFASDSFDLVLSYQAIDAYGPVAFWYDAVADMLRIARESVGLVLNPAFPRTDETQAQADRFIADMQARHGATVAQCPETGLPALRIDKP